MNWLFSRVLLLAWAVWLGGLVGVFVAVTRVFGGLAPDRALAGTVAAGVFHSWERAMLYCAAACLASSLALALRRASRAAWGTVLLLVLAAAGTGVSAWVITPGIDRLRAAGLTQTPEFRSRHGLSMATYCGIALVLLGAGLTLRLDGVRGEQGDKQ
jgi:hypothetical protein